MLQTPTSRKGGARDGTQDLQIAAGIIHADLHLDAGLHWDIGVGCGLAFFDRDGGRSFEPIAGVDVAFFRHVDADVVNAVSEVRSGEFPVGSGVRLLTISRIALLWLLWLQVDDGIGDGLAAVVQNATGGRGFGLKRGERGRIGECLS